MFWLLEFQIFDPVSETAERERKKCHTPVKTTRKPFEDPSDGGQFPRPF